MAVKIRLARGGAKKRPFYRIVVADERAPRDGRYIERVGSYNPLLAKDNPKRVELNEERIKYWLGEGAQVTERIHRFLFKAGLMKNAPVWPEKKRPPKNAPQDEPEATKEADAPADAEAASGDDNAEAAEAAA